MITTLTICVLSTIAMLKWHSQPASRLAAIAEPTFSTEGRGYDNSVKTMASSFRSLIS